MSDKSSSDHNDSGEQFQKSRDRLSSKTTHRSEKNIQVSRRVPKEREESREKPFSLKHAGNRLSLFNLYESPKSKRSTGRASSSKYGKSRAGSLGVLDTFDNLNSSSFHRKNRRNEAVSLQSINKPSLSHSKISIPYKSEEENLNLPQTSIFAPSSLKRPRSKEHLHKAREVLSVDTLPITREQSIENFCQNCLQAKCPYCRNVLHPNSYRSMSQDALYKQPARRKRLSFQPFSHSMEDFDAPFYSSSRIHLNDFPEFDNNPLDELQIEYAAEIHDDPNDQLSEDQQNSIMKLGGDVLRTDQPLDNMAAKLKHSLDKAMGPEWKVVIGTDTFGSNLECLPGALMHFKIRHYVFLVWQI